jgi:hypothetical protein
MCTYIFCACRWVAAQQEANLAPEKCVELLRLHNCVLSMLQQRMAMRDCEPHEYTGAHCSPGQGGQGVFAKVLLALPAIYSIHQSTVQSFFFGGVNLDVTDYVAKLLFKESSQQGHTA